MRSTRLVIAFGLVASFLAARTAVAASLKMVSNWGASGVPSYISMYVYVPDAPAANPPILVVAHYCGGSASGVFGQAQSGGIVAAADKYGFMMIFPQTTNAASSAKCWDVGSKQSLTHDGGGDTQAVAQMVKYAVTTYKANPDRVYATGDSSGAMMTQALLGVYPDVFKGGSSFAGVPAGCWSAGWSAASNWGGTCAGGNYIQTPPQWGDLVRGMYPGYAGHRPRVQLFHGDADSIINYKDFGEAIKEWTNVLGLATSPTSTATALTLGSHQATRQQWKNACGYVVLDAFTSMGGDHGPSDALFNASYVVPFLGLDKVGDVDPEIAACGGAPDGGAPDGATDAGGSGGSSGGGGGAGGGSSGGGGAGGRGGGGGGGPGGRGGTSGAGASGGTGGAGTGSDGAAGVGGNAGSGGAGASGGAPGRGGSPSGGAGGSVAGAGGAPGLAGQSGTAGTTGAGGTSGTGHGGAAGNGAGGAGPGSSGCSLEMSATEVTGRTVGLALALIICARRRQRRHHRKHHSDL